MNDERLAGSRPGSTLNTQSGSSSRIDTPATSTSGLSFTWQLQKTNFPAPKPSKTKHDSRQRCLACNKLGCQLVSHRSFTQTLRRRILNAPSQELTNPRIDPFARYPIEMTAGDHYLLDLWARPWGVDTSKGPERHLFPESNIRLLLPTALGSPLVFRAALALTATQTGLARGGLEASAYVQQRKIAKLHMETVRDSIQANSDANILAGLAIMSNYMGQGQIKEGRLLLNGINELVKSRGGPQYLGARGLVAGYLMLADHYESICNCRKPIWQMPLPGLKFDLSPLKIGYGFAKQNLDPDFLHAINDLCCATQIFDMAVHKRTQPKEIEAFEYLNMLSEYQLALRHAEYWEVMPRKSCICLALLIFDHTVLRNAGAIPPAMRLEEERFWKTFQKVDAHGGWNGDDGFFLMWIILTPMIIAIRAPCPYWEYGIERLKIIQQEVRLESWEDMKEKVLQPFLWFGMAQEELLRGVCQEIGVEG